MAKNETIGARYYISLFLLLECAFKASGQDPVFRHFGVETGLPSSEVYQTFFDNKGNAWITTDLGLVKYDGNSFKTYGVESGLADYVNFIFYDDGRGKIWLSGYNAGLSYIENNKIYAYEHNAKLTSELLHRVIRKIHLDREYNLRIYPAGFEYCIKVDSSGVVSREPFLSFEPDPGRVYYGRDFADGTSVFGCYSSNDDPKYWKNAHFYHVNENNELNEYHFELPDQDELYLDYVYGKTKDGTLIFAIDGLVKIIPPNGAISNVPLNSKITYTFTEDQEGGLWLGLFHDGAIRIDQNSASGYETFFHGKSVSHINQDPEGGYWISTLSDGVYYIPDLNFRSAFGHNEKPTWVRSIVVHNNEMIGGDDLGNLYSWQLDEKGAFTGKSKILDNLLRVFHVDTMQNQLYIASSSPHSVRRLGSQEAYNFTARTLSVQSDNRILVSLGACVYEYNAQFERTANICSQLGFTMHAHKIRKYGNGCLLAHSGGLTELTGDGYIEHANLHPELRTRISDVVQFRDGMLLATHKGVLYYDGVHTINLTKDHSLKFKTCRTLEVENNNVIWAGTDNGVIKIELQNSKLLHPITTTHFLKNDGLSSANIYDLALVGDFIWVSSTSGVNYFPKQYKPRYLPPISIEIASMRANGEELEIKSDLELPASTNNLLFRFKGNCLRCQGNIHFKYRLLGADSSWVETSSQNVQFSNLFPRKYSFELFAGDYTGAWNSTKKIVSFSIRPRFWQIPWVQVLSVIFVFAVIAILLTQRFRVINRQNKLNRRIDKLHFQALNAQMNPHFVFNALNAIQQFVLRNDPLMSNKYLGKFARLMRLVLNNSQEQLVGLDDDLETLLIYIEIETLRFPGLFKWSIDVDPELDTSSIKVPPLLMQPLVENSIKHGLTPKNGNGELLIRINKSRSHLLITVSDNGIGIKSAETLKNGSKHKSVGLGHTRKRIELLQSIYGKKVSFEVVDLENTTKGTTGTRIHLKLPLLIAGHTT